MWAIDCSIDDFIHMAIVFWSALLSSVRQTPCLAHATPSYRCGPHTSWWGPPRSEGVTCAKTQHRAETLLSVFCADINIFFPNDHMNYVCREGIVQFMMFVYCRVQVSLVIQSGLSFVCLYFVTCYFSKVFNLFKHRSGGHVLWDVSLGLIQVRNLMQHSGYLKTLEQLAFCDLWNLLNTMQRTI